MLKIGGASFKNGIALYSEDAKVKCYYNNINEIKIKTTKCKSLKVKTNKVKKYLLNIPFIRGIVVVANLFLTICFICADILRQMAKTTGTTKVNNTLKYSILGLMFVITIGCLFVLYRFLKDIRSTFRFHGAEHKVIDAYENGRAITIENIAISSRVSPSCGTVLGIFFAFFMLILFPLIRYKTIVYLLSVSISYELFRIDNPECHWYSRYFYSAGLLVQKYLTTLEPTEKEMLIAKECMINLLKLNDTDLIMETN